MIPLSFFHNPDVVAMGKSLLGKGLFTEIDGEVTGGIIIETESYAGVIDRASHAFGGRRTARTEVMYAKGGVAYVYLCYGMHNLLNVVTGEEGTPHAVLIRAIEPTCGLEKMLERRKKKNLTAGPGALTMALGITRQHNGLSFTKENNLWITDLGISPKTIQATPRIGVDYAGPDALLPYRFLLEK